MRHFRNLLWFFVGILLVSVPMFSYAINLQLGKYYQVDSNVVRNMSDIARPISTNNFTTAMADSWKVNLTSDLTATMEKGLVRVPLTDTIAADVGVFTKLGRQASRCLASGVAIAVCTAGAAATVYVADKLVEKGHQWMDSAKCQVTAGCTTPGWNSSSTPSDSVTPDSYGSRCKARLHSNWDPYISSISVTVTSVVTIEGGVQLQLQCVATTIAPYQGTRFDNDGYNILESTSPCPTGYTLSYSTYLCSYSGGPIYAPESQDIIDAATDDIVKSNISPFVDAVRKDGTILSLDDSTKTTTAAQPTIGPAVPSQTTTQNPDGSTTTQTKQTQKTYNPSGSGNAADPITINTTTTETTNTCTGAGSCTTTNKTTTEAPADTKTQCDLYPNSLACAGLGTPPDGDIPSQTVNTDYQQDGRISFSHTCPAPQQYTVHGVVYFSDWTLLCQYSTKIKPLIIGAAAFLAALIVAYGHKS